jgi:hypothetical protein
MDYGALVGEAWRLTWRHRFAWIFGLFAAGSAGGFGINPQMPGGFGGTPTTSRLPSATSGAAGTAGTAGTAATAGTTGASGTAGLPFDEAQLASSISDFVTRYAGLIVVLVLLAVVLGLILFVVSVLCHGAMARTTLDLALGRPVTLGSAWAAGRRLFWRYLGLDLLLLAVSVVVALVAAFGLALTLIGALVGGSKWGLGASSGVLAVFIGLAVVAAGACLAVIVAFAQRSIAAHDVGPLTALGEGWRLFRAAVGTGLLLWLVSLVAGIAFGFAMAMVLLIVAIPLIIVGGVLAAVAGQAALVPYIVVASLLALAVLWLLVAVMNTFQWHYWTQAYLRLTGQAIPAEA